MRPLILIALLLLQSQAPATSKISGHVVTFPGERLPETLTLRVYGQSGPGGMIVTKPIPVQTDGTFEISGLVPGEFSVSIGSNVGSSPGRNFMLRAGTGGVTGLDMKVPAAVSGRVVLPDGSPFVVQQFFIQLTTPAGATNINPAALNKMRSQARTESNGRFVLSAFPGENTFSFEQLPPGYVVKSVMYGSTDVLNSPLKLDAVPTNSLVVTLDSLGIEADRALK